MRSIDRRLVFVDMVVLLTLWVAVICLVDPRGDFPLIDDWAYALPVEHLVETGDLRFTAWQSMPLVPQVLWGALFSLPDGFSFTAVRLSTLVLAACAVVAQYFLFLAIGAGRGMARLAAILLIANPVFVCLSFTFMTDVPFLALALASTVCLLRALERPGALPLFAGFVLAGLATLLRQVGLAIPIAFFFAAWLCWGLGHRLVTAALLPALAVAATLIGYEHALAATDRLPELYPMRSRALGAAVSDLLHGNLGVLRYPIDRGVQMALYTGLFALPIAIGMSARGLYALRGRRRTSVVAAVGAISLTGASILVLLERELPRFGNVLVDFGVGVRTLPGPPPPGAPPFFWWIVTGLAVASAAVVVACLARGISRTSRAGDTRRKLAGPALLAIIVGIYFAPLSLAYGPSFERYFLLPAAFAAALAAWGAVGLSPSGRLARLFVALAVAAPLIFGVAGTRDYLEWNRVRYRAASWLQERAQTDAIDAGFEFGSWQETAAALRRGEQGARIDRPEARYAVVFSASSEEEILREFPYDGWLFGAPSAILAVRREEAPPARP